MLRVHQLYLGIASFKFNSVSNTYVFPLNPLKTLMLNRAEVEDNMMMQIVGSFAEFERDMLRKWTHNGLNAQVRKVV